MQKSFEVETELDRLNVENETLREEVQSLAFKTDELQTELDATRQVRNKPGLWPNIVLLLL